MNPAIRTAVIAIGGNSLIEDNSQPQVENQWDAVRKTCQHIAMLISEGWQVVVTHGNGPQVGFILRRNELAAHEVHTTPLDLIGADTQGAIGYMLQQALDNSLRAMGLNKSVISIVTQTLVSLQDSAFQNPTKPIGSFTDEAKAREYEKQGWQMMEDAGRGWRRVVASPQPLEIIELGAIRAMIKEGYIAIACGGGGIPVVRNTKGELRGVNAVIDKDRASGLLAAGIGADLFIISTAVPQVAIHFNTPQQQNLSHMTLAEAKQYLQAGHFAVGSMKPKIEAVINFLERGGPQALITNPDVLAEALKHEAGTWITPN
ncbi:MAG: carbamate kinase [Anaerolineae bacterium]|nr:carbamate kinase [Anaerolineae bacterium]